MRIYIAGKITGDKNYKKKFAKAERALKKKGHSVMNPAWLKEYGEFDWIDYMGVSGAMQQTCEAVYFPRLGGEQGRKLRTQTCHATRSESVLFPR